LDAQIQPSKEQELLQVFTHEVAAAWPAIRPRVELEGIRSKFPILLLSIMAYAFPQEMQGIDIEVHNEHVRQTMNVIGSETVGKDKRSLELVQALLVAAFWNKMTRRGQQGSCYQLLQLAIEMAIDIIIHSGIFAASQSSCFLLPARGSNVSRGTAYLACLFPGTLSFGYADALTESSSSVEFTSSGMCPISGKPW
jgi:hypothetical protein